MVNTHSVTKNFSEPVDYLSSKGNFWQNAAKASKKHQRPTQDNPIFEDIDSSPECSNGVKKDTNQDIRLIEKYNIQNKRLQMIVDILSKDVSSILVF